MESRSKEEALRWDNKWRKLFGDDPKLTETSEKVSKAPRKHGQLLRFPIDISEDILLRMSLSDVLASRSICHEWAAVFASQQFQATYHKREQFIVINNKNLDIWAFSLASKHWFPFKIPCDWEDLGFQTLGVKATCEGLFLVARSDLNLFVVNPLTAQFQSLPSILPGNELGGLTLKSLIVDGTAEMSLDRRTGSFTVYLFGDFHDGRNSCVHLARYSSTAELWTMQPISLYGIPLSSTSFPSPLRSFRRANMIICISSTCLTFRYLCNNNNNTTVDGNMLLNIPATVDIENHDGAVPAIFPHFDGHGNLGYIMVARLKEHQSENSTLAIWKIGRAREWEMIDTIQPQRIEQMIQSSEGTDFLVMVNYLDTLWFMMRGSQSMVEYNITTKELLFLSGCPGGGYMDTSFHRKALIGYLQFSNILNHH